MGYTIQQFTTTTVTALTSTFSVDFNARVKSTLTSGISGTGDFTFDGPGMLTLAANSTYNGTTTISAGTLALGSANAIGSTGTISFAGGTLQFSAANMADYSGRFSTAAGQQVAIDTSGQTVSLASALTSSGGSLTKTGAGNLVLSAASTYGGGTSVAADLLVVSGDLDLSTDPGNLSLLTFADIAGTTAPFMEDTTVFAMINYTGVWNGGLFSYNGTPLADGSRFTVGSQQWEIDYDYQIGGTNIQPLNFAVDQSTGGSYVAITAVPEPATLAGLACNACLVRRRWKRG